MRSRYTAYSLRDTAYLLATWHPTTRPARLDLDRATRWTGLTVEASSGGLLDATGSVMFVARYEDRGVPGLIREGSRFVREDGRWLYVDGVLGQ